MTARAIHGPICFGIGIRSEPARLAHHQLVQRGFHLHGVMCDQQSQAPSTHHAPFDAWLKKTLRLNRDPSNLLLPFDDIPGARGEVP
jgi:hypothetical protein